MFLFYLYHENKLFSKWISTMKYFSCEILKRREKYFLQWCGQIIGEQFWINQNIKTSEVRLWQNRIELRKQASTWWGLFYLVDEKCPIAFLVPSWSLGWDWLLVKEMFILLDIFIARIFKCKEISDKEKKKSFLDKSEFLISGHSMQSKSWTEFLMRH